MASASNKSLAIGAKPLKVVLTGAAGQIGYALIPLLASGRVFGFDREIDLRLLEIEPAMKALSGVIMELEDCAFPLIVSIMGTANPSLAMSDVDVAIFVGGFPRKKGMERKDLLRLNAKIFSAAGKALDSNASKNVKVLVVANPCNTNCMVLLKHAPSLNPGNFSCLTRLDQNRATALLAKQAAVSIKNLENDAIIYGNHSKTMAPDWTQVTVAGKTLESLGLSAKYLEGDFICTVQQRGAAVIEARGLSSAMSAANAIKDHLRTWLNTGSSGKIVSMGVVSQGTGMKIGQPQISVPAGLVCSVPVRCKGDGSYEVVNNLKLSDFMSTKIRESVQELDSERNTVLELLKSAK